MTRRTPGEHRDLVAPSAAPLTRPQPGPIAILPEPRASFVAAVEFSSPPRAKVLTTYGNTSDPASPHFGDQLPLSARGQLRDAWLTRAAVEANLESRTVLRSDGRVDESAGR